MSVASIAMRSYSVEIRKPWVVPAGGLGMGDNWIWTVPLESLSVLSV